MRRGGEVRWWQTREQRKKTERENGWSGCGKARVCLFFTPFASLPRRQNRQNRPAGKKHAAESRFTRRGVDSADDMGHRYKKKTHAHFYEEEEQNVFASHLSSIHAEVAYIRIRRAVSRSAAFFCRSRFFIGRRRFSIPIRDILNDNT